MIGIGRIDVQHADVFLGHFLLLLAGDRLEGPVFGLQRKNNIFSYGQFADNALRLAVLRAEGNPLRNGFTGGVYRPLRSRQGQFS
ncbi:hypothetical protein D3C76_1514910 [compost metagenome]